VREFLLDIHGPDALPVNTSYGDGEPIDPDTIALINRTYDAHTVYEPLHAGDLMLLDNIRTGHNREPFRGNREVLVAMAEPLAAATTETPPAARSPTVSGELIEPPRRLERRRGRSESEQRQGQGLGVVDLSVM
jgi:hypothetical protein